jgi:hypothetical protein
MVVAMEDDLAAVVRDLAARVEALERRVTAGAVEAVLRQRGWQPGPHSPADRLLLPVPPTPDRVDRFYADLHRYHFRRLLQEAAERRVLGGAVLKSLAIRWGARAVAATMTRLEEYGLLRRRGGGYERAARSLGRFGDTLEWFVAQVCVREFAAPAVWDARILDISRGGDFDVLAVLQGGLAYVECKGSPPYNIPAASLERFVDRVHRLRPELAVLLVDTTLEVDRNIIDNLRRLLDQRGTPRAPARVGRGVYEWPGRPPLYVVTARRSLVANLRTCLRRWAGGSQ